MNEELRPGTPASGWRSDELARYALFAFIVTFIAARALVFLLMSRHTPNLNLFLGSTHVHHLNCGIFLLAAVGAYLLLWHQSRWTMHIAALTYGMAMALIFDEFGMWLHLGGSYWQRASIDAVAAVAAVLALFAIVLYDASMRVGHREGEHLRHLVLDSLP